MSHRQRRQRPIMFVPNPPSAKLWASFWARVRIDHDTGCWLWIGGTGTRNHSAGRDGRIRLLDLPGQPLISAHRLMCWWAHGAPSTPRHHACHTAVCSDTLCVHPAHLYWGTQSQNEQDKRRRATDRIADAYEDEED